MEGKSSGRMLKLGSVCSKIGSGATPRGGSKVYLDQGDMTLIRSQNVYNEGFNRNGVVFISPEHADHLRNVEVFSRDVLLNITGDSVARCCQVVDDVLPARVNQHVSIIRPDAQILDPRYLCYYLVSPVMQSQMLSWAGSGGTRNALTKSMIESFEIPIPGNISEQRAIAHILGSLDDKIELNRRMNETLETMAQAIFKSWFVDFDPVRAKAEGRDTGLPGEIADLFPDSFEDSEPGAIPRWWEESTIGENAEKLSKGTTPRKQDVSLAGDSPTVPFLKVRNISDSGEIDISSLEKVPRSIHEKALKRSVLKANDVLFSIAGTIGRVTILPMELDDSNTNQAVAFIRPHAHGLPAQFIRLLLISDRIQFEAKSRVVQGVQANVSLTVLSELTFPKPSSELIDVWYRYCGGIFEQQMLLLRESRTLASLRDTLLSKLISGELRVPDAALELVAQAGVPDADKLIEGVGA